MSVQSGKAKKITSQEPLQKRPVKEVGEGVVSGRMVQRLAWPDVASCRFNAGEAWWRLSIRVTSCDTVQLYLTFSHSYLSNGLYIHWT